MILRSKFWCALVALASLPVFLGGCQQEVGDPTGVAIEANAKDPERGNTNMPAFFGGFPITINVVEFPSNAEAVFLRQISDGHSTTNQIFASADLDLAQPVPPVVDAIQGDRFNPRWRQIRFDLLVPPDQVSLHSVDDITAAFNAGLITQPTPGPEFYRCAVVGPGPKPQ